MDTIEFNDTKVNQTAINMITTDKVPQRSEEPTLGHERDDQRLLQTNGKDNKSFSNKLKDIKKFDGRSNPEELLEYVINKLDEMNFSIQEKYKSIPELLREGPRKYHQIYISSAFDEF